MFGSRHSCLEFRFQCQGFGHLYSTFCLFVGVCGLEFRSAARSSVHVCFVVLHAACVFHWLRAFMFSCPVLNMAGDLFAGHVLVFLFCVSTWLLS